MKALLSIILALFLIQLILTQSTEESSGRVDCPVYPPGVTIGIQCPFDFEGDGYCSYSKNEETGEYTQTWAGNTCDACSTAEYYIPGQCPGDKVYCDTYANAPPNCDENNDPACGYYSNEPWNDDGEFYPVGTFVNECTACQAKVTYYTRGKCVTDE